MSLDRSFSQKLAPEVLCKKVARKNLADLAGKHLWWTHFLVTLNKV